MENVYVLLLRGKKWNQMSENFCFNLGKLISRGSCLISIVFTYKVSQFASVEITIQFPSNNSTVRYVLSCCMLFLGWPDTWNPRMESTLNFLSLYGYQSCVTQTRTTTYKFYRNSISYFYVGRRLLYAITKFMSPSG